MSARYLHPAGRFSLDVFVKRVLGKLYLSETMALRAEPVKEFESHEFFGVYLVSKEDLFLFKSVTSAERVRDIEDLIVLVETGLGYDVIIQELERQLSRDESLRTLLSVIRGRIDLLAGRIGAVKGLVNLREFLEDKSSGSNGPI